MLKSGSKYGLTFITTIFFVVMLVFVLCNAAASYYILVRYQNAVGQTEALNQMRTSSQVLVVNAIRLSDGAFTQTSRLGREIDKFDSYLQLLGQGGVINKREVLPVQLPIDSNHLANIESNWRKLKSRLQNVLIDTYSSDDPDPDWQNIPNSVKRQWLADDANALLVSIDATYNDLMPQIYGEKERLLLFTSVLLIVNLLVILAIMVIVIRYWIAPIKSLRKAMAEFMDGDYTAHLTKFGPAELHDIAIGFNTGVAGLAKVNAELQRDHIELQKSNSVVQGLAANSIVGVFRATADKFIFVSDKMADIFGYSADEMLEQVPFLNIIAPRERFLMAESIKSGLARKDSSIHIQRHGKHKSGSTIDIEIFCTILTTNGKTNIVGMVQDITERKRTESSAQLAAIAYENSSEAIVITDAAGVIIDVNPAYSKMSGYWPDEVVGEMLPLLQACRENQDFFDEMWHQVNVNGRWAGEYNCKHKNGDTFIQRAVIDTAWNHDGSVNCRVILLSDITNKKQIEQQIWHQAFHDQLTTLPNRSYFTDYLSNTVEQADSNHSGFVILFLDLDLFKEVNDSMGHDAGDQLLIQVAKRLRTSVADYDSFVARLGGDEFVVILNGSHNKETIDFIVGEVLDTITAPYEIKNKPVTISASIGIAQYPDDAEDMEALLRHVDMAMYVAKDHGRNGYHYFDSGMRVQARMHRDLLYTLDDAIAKDQFFLVYQPIYSLETGKLVMAEALLRWRHPEFGVIAPLDFIPFAEERKIFKPLGDWVFRESVRFLSKWNTTNPDFRLTVNVSLHQFDFDDNEINSLTNLLSDYEVPGSNLVLELSENQIKSIDNRARIHLRKLRKTGVTFSVGAVSIGMPALIDIHRMPFEILKLERTITEKLLESKHNGKVCEALINLAHNFNLIVIAEGITNQYQFDLLKETGCDAGQGFWFDEPLDVHAIEHKLRLDTVFPIAPSDQ